MFKDQAALYARSATKEEAHIQIGELDAYARTQGFHIADQHYFKDVSPEADNPSDREGLFFLLKAAERHEFDVVVVFSLCRIAHDTAQVEEIRAELQKHSVEVVEMFNAPLSDESRNVFAAV